MDKKHIYNQTKHTHTEVKQQLMDLQPSSEAPKRQHQHSQLRIPLPTVLRTKIEKQGEPNLSLVRF